MAVASSSRTTNVERRTTTTTTSEEKWKQREQWDQWEQSEQWKQEQWKQRFQIVFGEAEYSGIGESLLIQICMRVELLSVFSVDGMARNSFANAVFKLIVSSYHTSDERSHSVRNKPLLEVHQMQNGRPDAVHNNARNNRLAA